MATTNVHAGITISLLQNGDSLNTTLNSTVPLYQTFKKGTAEFSPNWATMPDGERPIVYPRVYSTMDARVLPVSDINWKYNGVAMTFDATGLCTYPEIAAGKVREIDYDSAKALKMVGNVASEANNDSDTISFTGNVSVSGQQIAVSSEITVLIEEAASNLYRLFLTMPDDVIDGDEESITLTATLYNMGVIVSSNVEYEFLDINGVVLKAKGSSNVLVVTRAMIPSEIMIVCKAYVSGKVVAQEQRQAWDSTDPYKIVTDKGDSVRQTEFETVVHNYSLLNIRTGNTVPDIVFATKVFRNSDSEDITPEFTKTNTSITVPGSKIKEHRSIYVDVSCTI